MARHRGRVDRGLQIGRRDRHAEIDARAAFDNAVHRGEIRQVALHPTADVQPRSNCPQEVESEVLACRLDELKFGYLSDKDRLLIRQAVLLRCEAFLTVERRLPRNAAHLERQLGIRIMTPITHWEMLQPWAALWL